MQRREPLLLQYAVPKLEKGTKGFFQIAMYADAQVLSLHEHRAKPTDDWELRIHAYADQSDDVAFRHFLIATLGDRFTLPDSNHYIGNVTARSGTTWHLWEVWPNG